MKPLLLIALMVHELLWELRLLTETLAGTLVLGVRGVVTGVQALIPGIVVLAPLGPHRFATGPPDVVTSALFGPETRLLRGMLALMLNLHLVFLGILEKALQPGRI